jgi:hypothetical protein
VPTWALPVVIVGLVVARLIAARQIAKGHRRFLWVYFAPMLAIAGAGVWAGLTLFGSNPAVGLIFSAASLVTFVLLFRIVMRTQPADASSPGELSGPWFDYLVWMALGAPFILVALLLVLAVTGGLNR